MFESICSLFQFQIIFTPPLTLVLKTRRILHQKNEKQNNFKITNNNNYKPSNPSISLYIAYTDYLLVFISLSKWIWLI